MSSVLPWLVLLESSPNLKLCSSASVLYNLSRFLLLLFLVELHHIGVFGKSQFAIIIMHACSIYLLQYM